MPELPEVEVTCQQLNAVLQKHSNKKKNPGLKIQDVEFYRKDLRFPMPVKQKKQIVNQHLYGITRRAKYLLFELDENYLLSHLGMSGWWRTEIKEKTAQKHDHIRLKFEGFDLVYNDPRRFGVFDCLNKKQKETHWLLCDLGLEPLDPKTNAEVLLSLSEDVEQPIKNFLMSQKIIVGVGNIYASECLFKAGISPFMKTRKLKRDAAEKLIDSIRETLLFAIEKGGSTLSDYRQVNGESGKFQNEHLVYGRDGEKCVVCSTPVRSKIFAGRNTFWCPSCQK